MFRFASLLLLLSSPAAVVAFAPVSGGQAKFPTDLSMGNTKQPPKLPPIRDISYGEASRKYRRTVYTHDDWVNHRSPDRFWRNLNAIFISGVYKNLYKEVGATTAVATFVVLWNALTNGYDTLSGEHMNAILSLPMLSLPLAPYTLSSPSLGLLLVFRTNTSYQRWDEARKNWGMNINHTRDLVRMATSFYDRTGKSQEQVEKDLKAVSLATWSFVRAMKRHLSPPAEDEEDFKRELYERLPAAQAQAIIDAVHRPNRALYDLSLAIENLPMHFLRKNQVQSAVTIFEDNLGSSERLLSSPVPLFYSRHTARFLSLWLLLLPIGLYEPFKDSWNHVAMIPATAAISVFLFGIEELATQMEEPFTILPMQAFCDKIGNWCNEIVSWTPGDNGMPVNESTPKHNNIAIVDGVAVPADDKSVVMQMTAPANGHGVNGADEKFSEPVSNNPSRLRKLIGGLNI
ncbi:UPF0187 protein [Seminavis robusta]|uniref:UPF0187 protein n=1 Tax=Seminavis robusta TaxID=568900 RepID=A0A9N8HAE4_9STRA|nr:UPF0187 protein [Seminavis robusta]|eukprot:Sro145_g067260.1 UPF0187 protein (459) ;mRNA; f:37451-39041